MTRAIIATVSSYSALGDSIGCLVPMDMREISLGKITRTGKRFKDGIYYERVEIAVLGRHLGLPSSNCLSIAFHFPIGACPIPDEEFVRRLGLLRGWLHEEFGIDEFEEKEFPSRIELCDYLDSSLHVM